MKLETIKYTNLSIKRFNLLYKYLIKKRPILAEQLKIGYEKEIQKDVQEAI